MINLLVSNQYFRNYIKTSRKRGFGKPWLSYCLENLISSQENKLNYYANPIEGHWKQKVKYLTMTLLMLKNKLIVENMDVALLGIETRVDSFDVCMRQLEEPMP